MIQYVTILPLVFILSTEDIEINHQMHYVSSLAIQQIAYVYTDCWWKSALISLTLGAAKELIHDKWMGRGNPSFRDMGWNAAGVANGTLFTFSIKF